jgi:hypothetical protein
MDLSNYLHTVKRALIAIVAAAVIVGGLAGYLTDRHTRDSSRGAVTLKLPQVTTVPQGTDAIAEDVIDAVTAPSVLQSVSNALSIPSSTLKKGLKATRVSDVSSFIDVTFTSKSASAARSVPSAVAQQALLFVLEPQLEAAQETQRSLRQLSTALTAKEQALLTPASGPSRRSSPAYVALTNEQQQLFNQVSQAAHAEATMKAQIGAAQRQLTASDTSVTAVSPLKRTVELGVADGGATAFALLMLLVGVEIWRTRREERPVATAGRRDDVEFAVRDPRGTDSDLGSSARVSHAYSGGTAENGS